MSSVTGRRICGAAKRKTTKPTANDTTRYAPQPSLALEVPLFDVSSMTPKNTEPKTVETPQQNPNHARLETKANKTLGKSPPCTSPIRHRIACSASRTRKKKSIRRMPATNPRTAPRPTTLVTIKSSLPNKAI